MLSTRHDINPSVIILTSMSIYFPLFFVGIILFELVRRLFVRAYNFRSLETNVFLTPTRDPFFKWILTVFKTTDEEIMTRCGLDTLTYLRVLRMGQKIAALTILCSIVLFPLYATASPPSTSSRKQVDPLEKITMSNLGSKDQRIWVSVVAAYVLSGYTMYLLLQEYQHYINYRHTLLGQLDASVYTVLINDLPIHLRTRQTLEGYMCKVFPQTIHSVAVAIECQKLEEMISTRESIRNRLEHSLALAKKNQERPLHRHNISWKGILTCQPHSRGWMVDSIDFYQEELEKLNEMIEREIHSLDASQARLAQQVEKDLGRVQYFLENPSTEEPPIEAEQSAREASREFQPIRAMRRAAFISFTSLLSAQVAQQTLQSNHPESMSVIPAPPVNDINWSNIGLQHRARMLGKFFSSVATALIVFFWTIPTAFIASLSTVESLRRALPFLNHALDTYPFLKTAVQQLAPLALVLFGTLTPLLFRFLSDREGHVSTTEVQASIFTKLAYFQLIQIFFVTVIVGTVLESLKEILDQPKTLMAMLGRSMPQQSTFFITYVMVLTGLSLTMELLRVVPWINALFFRILAPQLTRRERQSCWYGLRGIGRLPDPFDPTKAFADLFLVLLVSLTFATIAPLVGYFTGIYFVLADLVYRRQVMYVYQPSVWSMGAYWPRLYRFLIIALLVAQLTLLGLVSLKKAPVPFVFVFILMVITFLFHKYVGHLYPRVATFLPLTECVRLDEQRQTQAFTFIDNVYQQPAMRERTPLRVDYRILEVEYGKDNDKTDPEGQRLLTPTALIKE